MQRVARVRQQQLSYLLPLVIVMCTFKNRHHDASVGTEFCGETFPECRLIDATESVCGRKLTVTKKYINI